MTWRGPTAVVEETRGGKFYTALSATAAYQEVSFGFGATQLVMTNDNDVDAIYSFDGVTVHGRILARDTHNRILGNDTSVFIRMASGTGTVYVQAA